MVSLVAYFLGTFQLILGFVLAQDMSGEPACATSCLLSAISAAGCASTDISCQCNLSPAVVGPCLLGACNAEDLQIALTVGTSLCSSYSAAATKTPSPTLTESNSTLEFTGLTSAPTLSSSRPSTTSSPRLSATGTSSPQTSSASTSGAAGQTPAPASLTQTASGLSTGAKAGIGIGVSLGALVFAGFGAFAFWWGKRSEKRKSSGNEPAMTAMGKAELGPGIPMRGELEDTSVPLDDGEKTELERRRKVSELEGNSISPIGVLSERAELEALREKGNGPVEMD